MQINNLPSTYILTADIGGSHITAGICDLRTHVILDQSITRIGVDSKGSANDILTSWGDACEQVLKKNNGLTISGLSIAMPGPFDYPGGISYIKGLDKYEALYGMNIRQYLGALLKIDPQSVRFRNDAESTIAGEVLTGAGKDYQRVMGVTLGTGFGSAYSENKITKDINLGSEPYKDAIADAYLSTRWFLKRYHELTGTWLTGGVKELSELATTSTIARDLFKEFAINMSDFLSAPVQQHNPEVLIICGNIAKASIFFLPYLTEELNSVTIKLALLDENAPLIGAAAKFDDLMKPAF
ncbi:ROK family protein [Mucilaginibacter sp. OK098]|uniref:ROK family protein n=1 Tax=Mucilaginibacter sp. OK098 TaxID=1855297 RepID=UPI00091439ED|nr:ROK family protein [Mucilaginibacter sp. OK098]SHM20766.1 glucokinase [Mucilaginibacter sp. OK098]